MITKSLTGILLRGCKNGVNVIGLVELSCFGWGISEEEKNQHLEQYIVILFLIPSNRF